MNHLNAQKTPVLFVSHGSPTFALESAHTSASAAYLKQFAQALPAPRAIVVVSAHWQTRDLIAITSGSDLKTIHDFGGFAAPMYQLQYPAQGDPELAHVLMAAFASQALPVRLDAERGLDHGAWVPLMKLYPDAQIPVVQVSLPFGQSCETYYAMGQALTALRNENILIVCSGSLTHNLYDVRFDLAQTALAPNVAPYVAPFRQWFQTALQDNALDLLFNYRTLAPYAAQNHPTDEHLMPLYVAMGASGFTAQQGHADLVAGEFAYYTLAMDNISFT